MGEDGNGHEVKKQAPFMSIKMSEDESQVEFTTNIGRLDLGLGLLEMAKDYLKAKILQDMRRKVVGAKGISDFLRGGKKV